MKDYTYTDISGIGGCEVAVAGRMVFECVKFFGNVVSCYVGIHFH